MTDKKTIAIDLDGVLAQYEGWVSEDHTLPPVPGAKEFVEDLLQDGFDVAIYSTRPVLVVANWLDRWGFAFPQRYPIVNPASEKWGRIRISEGKPKALVYIDDRGFRFTGPDSWEAAKKAIFQIPWWKEEK